MSDTAPKKPAAVDQIYDHLKDLFGKSDKQALVMEFPGRVLDESAYRFNTDSIFANMTKPQPVVEAEFRLTDNLFDVDGSKERHITGGPNGKKLSESFEQALNNLAPKMDDTATQLSDRNKLRKWLNEPVQGNYRDKDGNVPSRIGLYEILLEEYETTKQNFEKLRLDKLRKAKASDDANALDDYAHWLATSGAAEKAKVEAAFNDLVIRGYYHEVRKFIGFLDVGTEAEFLDEAKSKMRSAAMMSLDETETVYPVLMQPTNWFEGLSTDFKPVDLLLDPEHLEAQLMSKYKEKREIQSQIQSFRSAHTGDEKALQKQVDDAQNELDNATSDMLQNYTEATFAAIKIAYNAYCRQNQKKPNDVSSAEAFGAEAKQGGEQKEAVENSSGHILEEEDIDKFMEFQKKTIQQQASLERANRQLARVKESHAKAVSTNTQETVQILQSRLASLQLEIDNLQKVVLQSGGADQTNHADAPLCPASSPKAGAFFDVIMHFKQGETSDTSSLHSGSDTSSHNVSFIFGSHGGSSSKEFSDFQKAHQSHNTDFEIGFRATKVTMDRGWLSPEVLDYSKDMYRLGETKYSDSFTHYPVAFIVAKDITMKIKVASEHTETAKKFMQSQSSSSGGFLCFGASSSHSNTNESNSSYSGVTDESIIIRIPGPQILMWVLEEVPVDRSAEYPKDKSAIPDFFSLEDPSALVAKAEERRAFLSDDATAETDVSSENSEGGRHPVRPSPHEARAFAEAMLNELERRENPLD